MNNREWHDAMQRAWITQEDCTCPSEGQRVEMRPHDDDCPTALLRERLVHPGEPDRGWGERILAAPEKAISGVADEAVGRLGLWALPVVAVLIVAWMGSPFVVAMPTWWGWLSIPVSVFLGAVGGAVIGRHFEMLGARRGSGR